MGQPVDFAAAAFEASPNAYMILDRDLRYVAANAAYLAVTGRTRDELIGRRVDEEFPHDPDDPNNASRRELIASFRRVLDTGRPDVLPVIHYRIAIGGEPRDAYWSATHTPLFNADGEVDHVLQHTVNITDLRERQRREAEVPQITAGVLGRAEQISERTRALDEELRRVIALLDQTPAFLAFLRGPTHVFELANAAYQRIIGGRDVVGKTVRDGLPEIGERYFALLDHVYATGEPFVGTAMPVLLRHATGELAERYVDFVYQPVRDRAGAILGVLCCGTDVTTQVLGERERVALLQAEQAARAQAEAANRSKDQFLAIVSHELRTPLTAILGWMQMLRAGLVAPDKRERALETVERNARIQAQLIDDLLDVSRIISGKLALELESVELASVIAAAVETLRPTAVTKGVRIEVAIEASAPLIGDPRRLQQVVWNLLSNAIKFTPPDGLVQLRVERREDMLEIAVSDTGRGIAPELLPFVFDRWRRQESGSQRTSTGLGLGLSIVRHIVDAHGGTVQAYSDGIDRGTRVVVRLPVAIASRLLAQGGTATPLADNRLLAGQHVLVVEDDPDTREMMAALLARSGARVTTATSIADAMTAFATEPPDLLVSDLGLAGEDGFALIQRVRALPPTRGGMVPAVAVTAFAGSADRRRALDLGFHGHLSKPIDPGELIAVLGGLAGRGSPRN